MAKKVIQHHFSVSAKKITFKPAGKTNYVFEAKTSKGDFIVRIGRNSKSIHGFQKEHWVTEKVKKSGIPVPVILAVENKIIPLPYMIQKKIEGNEATDHHNRLNILHELGGYAKMIHSIPTLGFGNNFDFCEDSAVIKSNWDEHLEGDLNVTDRLNYLRDHKFLSREKLGKLKAFIEKIRNWNIPPCLNHCDLRLKNVIVNEKGKILALIDWENCISTRGPYWDFSIALHDLSIDGRQRFLEGYGLDKKEFDKMSFALTAFNLLNYVPTLQTLTGPKNKTTLDFYRLRLKGALDLFSL